MGVVHTGFPRGQLSLRWYRLFWITFCVRLCVWIEYSISMFARTAFKFVERSVKAGTSSIPLRGGRRTGHLGLGTVPLGGGVAFRPEDSEQTPSHLDTPITKKDGLQSLTTEQGETIFDGEDEVGTMNMEETGAHSAEDRTIGREHTPPCDDFEQPVGAKTLQSSADSVRTSSGEAATAEGLLASVPGGPGTHRAIMGKLPLTGTTSAPTVSPKRSAASAPSTAGTTDGMVSASSLPTGPTASVASVEPKLATECKLSTVMSGRGGTSSGERTAPIMPTGARPQDEISVSPSGMRSGSPISTTATSTGQGGATTTGGGSVGGGSVGGGKSVEAYRFLLHHIDAEIAALKRRHTSVSNHRVQLEDQQATRIRELYNFMESPWLMLRTTLSPPLPDTGVAVYLKEQMLQKRGGGRVAVPPPLDVARDKMFVLACQKNYRSLSLKDKQPYEEAARYNSILRQEMKRRLSTGCARFEVFCDQVHECTAVMVRDGRIPPFPAGTVIPSASTATTPSAPSSTAVSGRTGFLPSSRRGTISRGMPRLAAAALSGQQHGALGASTPASTPPVATPPGTPRRNGSRVMSRGKVRVRHHSPSSPVGVGSPTSSTSGKMVGPIRAPLKAVQQAHQPPSKPTVPQRERSSLMRVRHSARRTIKQAAVMASKKKESSELPSVGKPSIKKPFRTSANTGTRKKNALQRKQKMKGKTKELRGVPSGLESSAKKRESTAKKDFAPKPKRNTQAKTNTQSVPLATVIQHVSQKLQRGSAKSRRTPSTGSVVVLSENRSPSLPLPQVGQRLQPKRATPPKKAKKTHHTHIKKAKKDALSPKRVRQKTS